MESSPLSALTPTPPSSPLSSLPDHLRTPPSGSSSGQSGPWTPGTQTFEDILDEVPAVVPDSTDPREMRRAAMALRCTVLADHTNESDCKAFYRYIAEQFFLEKSDTVDAQAPRFRWRDEFDFGLLRVQDGPSWQAFQQQNVGRVMADRRRQAGRSTTTVMQDGFWTMPVPGNWGVRRPDFAIVAECATQTSGGLIKKWCTTSQLGDYKPASKPLDELCCQVVMYVLTMHHAAGTFLATAVRHDRFSRLMVINSDLVAIESPLAEARTSEARLTDTSIFGNPDFDLAWRIAGEDGHMNAAAVDAFCQHLRAARRVLGSRPTSRPLGRIKRRHGDTEEKLFGGAADKLFQVRVSDETLLHVAHLLRGGPESSSGSRRQRTEPENIGGSKRPRRDLKLSQGSAGARKAGSAVAQGKATNDTAESSESRHFGIQDEFDDSDSETEEEDDSDDADKSLFRLASQAPPETERTFRIARLVEWLEGQWQRNPPPLRRCHRSRDYRQPDDSWMEDMPRKPMVPLAESLKALHMLSPGLRIAMVTPDDMDRLVEEAISSEAHDIARSAITPAVDPERSAQSKQEATHDSAAPRQEAGQA